MPPHPLGTSALPATTCCLSSTSMGLPCSCPFDICPSHSYPPRPPALLPLHQSPSAQPHLPRHHQPPCCCYYLTRRDPSIPLPVPRALPPLALLLLRPNHTTLHLQPLLALPSVAAFHHLMLLPPCGGGRSAQGRGEVPRPGVRKGGVVGAGLWGAGASGGGRSGDGIARVAMQHNRRLQ